ncbi:MAG: hypothetical protein ACHQQ3_11360 [Gemmatimonadales bacterium]
MTATRWNIAGLALLIAAASQAGAQQRAPRGGGGGAVPSPSNQPAMSTHVSSRGPFVTNTDGSSGRSRGGSWDGRRPDFGGSPPARRQQRGVDLSAFFGYVPPRGQSAQNVPLPPGVRFIPAFWDGAVQPSAPPAAESPDPSDPAWDVQYSTQPVAQSLDKPIVRRGTPRITRP